MDLRKRAIFLLIPLLLLSMFLAGSCDLDRTRDEDTDETGEYTPGDTLPDAVTNGTEVTVPAGITVDDINGDAYCLDGEFPITIVLTNTSSQTVTVTFPAGSTYWVENGDTQNLIIVYDVSIEVTAGDTVTYCLPTFCLNSSLSAPGGSDQYVLGTVYTGGCIGTIIDIIASKDPSAFDYYDLAVIQDAIWDCMDYGEIDEYTLNELNAM